MVNALRECIKDKKIAIIGAGGLGGYLISYIARLNPKAMAIFDGDTFCRSNMNRQLFCSIETLGKNKAIYAKEGIKAYTTSEITAFDEHLTAENSFILKDYDVIMDATDNMETRLLMQKIGNEYKIPVIHGAVNGLFGQVAVLRPNTDLFSELNSTGKISRAGETLSYVPALIASVQVSELLKYFANVNPLENDRLIIIDLLTNEARILKL